VIADISNLCPLYNKIKMTHVPQVYRLFQRFNRCLAEQCLNLPVEEAEAVLNTYAPKLLEPPQDVDDLKVIHDFCKHFFRSPKPRLFLEVAEQARQGIKNSSRATEIPELPRSLKPRP
jgi:hypothetical protein